MCNKIFGGSLWSRGWIFAFLFIMSQVRVWGTDDSSIESQPTIFAMTESTTATEMVQLKKWDFETSPEGWYSQSMKFPDYKISKAPIGYYQYGKLAHTASQPEEGEMRYGSWYSPNFPGDKDLIDINESIINANGGNLILAECKLTASAATVANVPNYRILYMNTLYSHIGGMHSIANSLTRQYRIAPTLERPLTVKLLWTPPFTMTGMKDGGTLDGNMPIDDLKGWDFRDYFIEFDIIDTLASDTGMVALDEVTVSLVPLPTTKSIELKKWGSTSGSTPFNASEAMGGFHIEPNETDVMPLNGYIPGSAKAEADKIVFQLASSSTGSYKAAYTKPGVSMPGCHSDRIVRHTFTLSSSNPQATPFIRYVVGTQSQEVYLPYGWAETFDGGNNVYKYLAQSGVVPMCPQVTPTVLNCWTYSSSVIPDSYLTPQIDVFSGPSEVQGWPFPTSQITFGNLSITEYESNDE